MLVPSVTTAQYGPDDLRALPLAAGFTDIRTVAALTCARQGLLFITALIVGLNEAGYEQRYCYEHGDGAWVALAAWAGHDHPPGPWIKFRGEGTELLNPAFCRRGVIRILGLSHGDPMSGADIAGSSD
ncbi:hypothetical protein [Variovorax sp. PvP013]|uniref:hypothetical protein n=1 Tax=Variovorax sp. PvP013 TaxID=3156435 RepID=UPI003D203982